jgi:hypothetical protein
MIKLEGYIHGNFLFAARSHCASQIHLEQVISAMKSQQLQHFDSRILRGKRERPNCVQLNAIGAEK